MTPIPALRPAALCLLALCPPAQAATPPAEPVSCLLLPARESAVASDTQGIIAEVVVARAQKVARGDVLVRLDDRFAQAELTRAKVLNDNAQTRLARGEALKGAGISQEELGTLRAEAALAEADVKRAELQIERTRILAPFAGTVAAIQTEEGQLTGGDPLIILLDLDGLKAEIVLPAEAWGSYQIGGEVALSDDVTGAPVLARISSIDRQIDPKSLTFTVMAEFANPEGRIPAGAGCRLTPP